MGRTKALIEIDGVAMADRVLGTLRAVGAGPLVVYGGDPDELARVGAPVIPDEFPGSGPVGGVLGVLNHLSAESPLVDHVVILPCDVAMIAPTTLLPLLEASSDDPDRVVVARTSRVEPMCAIWPIRVRTRVAELFHSGERALHRIIEQVPHVAIDVEPPGLVNINTPDDLPG